MTERKTAEEMAESIAEIYSVRPQRGQLMDVAHMLSEWRDAEVESWKRTAAEHGKEISRVCQEMDRAILKVNRAIGGAGDGLDLEQCVDLLIADRDALRRRVDELEAQVLDLSTKE